MSYKIILLLFIYFIILTFIHVYQICIHIYDFYHVNYYKNIF